MAGQDRVRALLEEMQQVLQVLQKQGQQLMALTREVAQVPPSWRHDFVARIVTNTDALLNVLRRLLAFPLDDLPHQAEAEIRSPMTCLKGYAELLLMHSGPHMTPPLRRLLYRMQHNIDLLIALTAELGETLRARQRSRPRPIPLALLFEDVLFLSPRHRDIHLHIPPDLAQVWVDEQQGRLSLTQLIVEALDHAPPGKAVFITTGRGENAVLINAIVRDRISPLQRLWRLFGSHRPTQESIAQFRAQLPLYMASRQRPLN